MVLHQTKELQDNTAKETINRIKWQFLEWEKIFLSKQRTRLISKTYKLSATQKKKKKIKKMSGRSK